MDKIKIDLRSVLLSKVGGVPLRNVESDYRGLVRERLDWRNLNFQTLEQFLEALPDVVRVEKKNGEMYAFGIAGNMFINPTARKAQYKAATSELVQNHRNDSSQNMDVYIGNLPLDVTEENLRSFLSAYSFSCIRIKKQSGISCAFVGTSRAVGDRMCVELNHQEFGEHRLRVEASAKSRKHRKQNSADFSSKSKSSTDSDADCQPTGAVQNAIPFSAGASAIGMERPNSLRESMPLGVDVETTEPALYHSDDFAGRSTHVKMSPPVTNPLPLDSHLPPTAFGHINNMPSGKASEEESSKVIWDSDDELPALIDSRLEEYEITKRMKSTYIKENLQSSQADVKMKEPVKQLPIPDGICRLVPNVNGMHPNVHSSSKSAKHYSINNFTSESNKSKKMHDSFNLYVTNIPHGTTAVEMKNLFKNCIKIVPLKGPCCFVIFNTMQEVESAAQQIWTIHGSLLVVDVATRHKATDPLVQADRSSSTTDLHSEFETMTCTIGNGSERKVRVFAGNCTDENASTLNFSAKHQNNCRGQFPNQSSVAGESIATSHQGNFDLPCFGTTLAYGPSKKQDRCSPLMTMQASTLSCATPLCSFEVASSLKSPQVPRGNSQSSSYPNMGGDNGSGPDCSNDWFKSYPNSPSGDSRGTVPKEMRLKELLGFYKDTYPGGTIPNASQLTDVVDIIVTVVVPEFGNSFMWGQLVAEPWKSELREMFDLAAKISQIERSLVRAAPNLRRGAAKYGDDWCR